MSLGGALYFVTFIDDFSRRTIVNFLNFKNKKFEKFKEFKALVEKQIGKPLKIFISNNKGEYLSLEFNKFCKENGIAR
jgi:transposase InsO family protein